MNSSWEPWNQVAHICPSLCQTVRKRSHIRASRQSAQFSINARIARRSAVSLGIDRPLQSWPGLSRRPTSLWWRSCKTGCSRQARARWTISGYEAMPRLAGKTAIVTGGAKGIGRHYSQALAAEGARVMIADIADGRELAEEIAGRYGANSVASMQVRRQRREGGEESGGADHRSLRPDRYSGEQCRALFGA